jgi:putative peptide zinc metalloprotease protein
MSSATAAANASMVPSTQRPIPLARRGDLVVKRIEYKGINSFVIKDPVGLKYHRLQQEQYRTLELLDGTRSLDEIKSELQRLFPALHFKLPDVQHLITDLHKKGLVQSNRAGQGIEMLKQELETKRKKRWAAVKNILYFRLPGWDPETTLNAIYPFFAWMFKPWAVKTAIAFVVSSWILIAVNFDAFYSKLPEFHQFFSWPNLAYMYLTLSLAKIIHEFGHGLSCKHFGGECHEMGVMLLVFSPCLYCDVSDSWMLRNKWKRIMIAAAGMYIEIIISAAAIFLWWYTNSNNRF